MRASDRLAGYRRKRDFAATPEPSAARKPAGAARAKSYFVVHLHHARARHFDFRLQVGDTLRSWAVPKGPSLDPRRKRLAVEVEDHPLEYGRFEGEIPAGQYGAGKVWIWDRGTWSAQEDPRKALAQGHLRFTLQGERLHGAWSLIRTRMQGKKQQWLLVKAHDEAERAGDQADDVPLSQWQRTSARQARPAARARKPRARGAQKSRAASLPAQVELQLARLVSVAPEGDRWLHEVKFDGYRILLWKNHAHVRITSRGNQDWTQRLLATTRAVAALPCTSCILDGELVSLDAKGVSRFGKLQQLFGEAGAEAQLQAMLFDVLWLDGEDLRALPQIDRKQRLATVLAHADAPLHLTPYAHGHGPRAAKQACLHGLEGIVCKDQHAPYQAGRAGAWLKVKCVASDEFAIVGYTTGQGSRGSLGSLLLATPTAKGTWRYWGRVGAGLSERVIPELLKRMQERSTAAALENPPTRPQLRGAHPVWVKPLLVAEVEFRGHTEDGLLRQASFKGLRRDRTVESLRPAQRNRAKVRAAGAGSKNASAAL